MTENEWLACTDPTPMLEFLRGKVSDRKLRLFACACVRRVWHLLTDERIRKALELTERHADGAASVDELREAHAAVDAICDWYANNIAEDIAVYLSLEAVSFATAEVADFASSCCRDAQYAIYREAVTESDDADGVGKAEYGRQCDLLRDIIGNPFRTASINPAWLAWNHGTISTIVQTICDNREVPSGNLHATRLAVVANALEEAGCANADILDHCRSDGLHVRGCWVVDLLLGKE